MSEAWWREQFAYGAAMPPIVYEKNIIWVRVALESPQGETLPVAAVLDTGCIGHHLVLPEDLAPKVQIEALGTSPARLANGQKIELPQIKVRGRLLGYEQPEPLLALICKPPEPRRRSEILAGIKCLGNCFVLSVRDRQASFQFAEKPLP